MKIILPVSDSITDYQEKCYLLGPIFKSAKLLNNTLVLSAPEIPSLRLFTTYTKRSTKHFGYSVS